MDDPFHLTSVTMPITLGNLPEGPRFEADGSSWSAKLDPMEPSGWRWWPNNTLALGKDGPEGEMSDVPPNMRWITKAEFIVSQHSRRRLMGDKPKSVTAKASGGARIILDNCYSTADELTQSDEKSSIVTSRVTHVPPSLHPEKGDE